MGDDRLKSSNEARQAAKRDTLTTGLKAALGAYTTDQTGDRIQNFVHGLTHDNPHQPDWIGVTRYNDELGRLRHAVYVRELLALPQQEVPLRAEDPFPNLGEDVTRLLHEIRQTLRPETRLDFYIIDREATEVMDDLALQNLISDGAGLELVWSARI